MLGLRERLRKGLEAKLDEFSLTARWNTAWPNT